MKSIEEIKNGLLRCAKIDAAACEECPYAKEPPNKCVKMLTEDTINAMESAENLIEKLKTENAELRARIEIREASLDEAICDFKTAVIKTITIVVENYSSILLKLRKKKNRKDKHYGK